MILNNDSFFNKFIAILFFMNELQRSFSISILMINNSKFKTEPNYTLKILSDGNISSPFTCFCECISYKNCLTIDYNKIDKTCRLFSASLAENRLHHSENDEEIVVISFSNRYSLGTFL